MRRFLALTLVLTATVVAVPTVFASAGGPQDLTVSLVSPVEPLTFRAEMGIDGECVTDVDVTSVEANAVEVTPLAVVQDDTDPNVVYVVLPSDTAPGTLEISVSCDVDKAPIIAVGDTEWGALAVTKVVEGPAPADAAFEVKITCDSEPSMEPGPEPGSASYAGVGSAGIIAQTEYDLAFGATGGTKYVYFDDASECLITEPVNGGATSTTIDPAEIINDAPAAYTSTVTNTFAAEVQPTFTG